MTDNKQKNSKQKISNKNEKRIVISEISQKIVKYFKGLTVNNYKNIFMLAFLILLSTILFYSYKMVFFPDSEHYYRMSKIILGDIDINQWQHVRGFGFPLIGSIFILLFGDNPNGLLTGSYIFYLFLMIFIGYFVQQIIKENKARNSTIIYIIFLLFVAFNTLILGYSHTFLTESVIPTIYLLVVFVLYKWYKIDYKNNRKKIVFINVVLILLAILIWFIKQPFSPAFYIALLITAVCSGIYFKSWKIFGQKMITFFLCLIFMVTSIALWNKFMIMKTGVSSNETNSSYLTDGIMGGTNVYYYKISSEEFCDLNYIGQLDISDEEKKKINDIESKDKTNWCSHILLYELKNSKGNHITSEVFISEDDKISVLEVLTFYLYNFVKHPGLIIRSYFYNYLAISDIQERDYSNGYRSSLEFSRYVYGENLTNGTYTFEPNVPTLGYYSNGLMDNYASKTPNNPKLSEILLIHGAACMYLFKILSIGAVLIFIYSFIKYIIHKNNSYFILSVCSLMHLINAIFNVMMGAVIDRYLYSTYPLMILCFIILLINKNDKIYQKK